MVSKPVPTKILTICKSPITNRQDFVLAGADLKTVEPRAALQIVGILFRQVPVFKTIGHDRWG
jgi:hypothetical protein